MFVCSFLAWFTDGNLVKNIEQSTLYNVTCPCYCFFFKNK